MAVAESLLLASWRAMQGQVQTADPEGSQVWHCAPTHSVEQSEPCEGEAESAPSKSFSSGGGE